MSLFNGPSKDVAAIVVTYNRLGLLKECIQALRSQKEKLNGIIVVNNGSTDGTREWLSEQNDLNVFDQENLGSSGGQYRGVKEAYGLGFNWFWCMDDDTIPEEGALGAFKKCPGFIDGSAGFLASRIVLANGKCQPLAFPLRDPAEWFNSVLEEKCVGTDHATFVSVLFNRQAVEEVGLPCKDFFIIWDDTEFTGRVSKWGKSYHCLESVAVHKTPDLGAPGNSTKGIKFKYHQRNRVWYIKLSGKNSGYAGWRIFKLVIRDIGLLILGKVGFNDFYWTLKGVFSTPKIEKV